MSSCGRHGGGVGMNNVNGGSFAVTAVRSAYRTVQATRPVIEIDTV